MGDLGKMARDTHIRNIRQDGGPGSGPQQGGGKMVNVALPKTKSKLTIQQAEVALAKQGYKLGVPSFKGGETSYAVTKDGKTTSLTTKEIKKKVFG